MTNVVTALVLNAQAQGIVANCIRMAPMDVRLLADENNWFNGEDQIFIPAIQKKPATLKWTFKEGYQFLGYQVQVDMSVVPGQPQIGVATNNHQRSN